MTITTTDVSSLAGLCMDCACGRTHRVGIRHIISGQGVLPRLASALEEFRGAHVFLVGDNNTMPMAEEPVRAMLAEAGCETKSHTFHSDTHLILDEALIGAMLIRMPSDTGLLVAIGSGTLNDLCRVVSDRCNIPYIIVATAPSMDGYASSVSPVVLDGGKSSFPLRTPHAIIADTDLMCTAPGEMLSSGVGDILGKYVALNDWKLAQRETGEYFCPYIADMISTAVGRCVEGIPRLGSRDPAVIGDMADTLILSGAAIAMHGLSRPASGCEHQLAHHWEVAMVTAGQDSPLHGNFVGLGTRVACRLYQLLGEEYDLHFPYPMPKPEEIEAHMAALGDFASTSGLGVTRELFYESFLHATSNGRYTLISLLEQRGRLEEVARRITDEFYP